MCFWVIFPLSEGQVRVDKTAMTLLLSALDTQLKLAEDGTITWQKDLTNPMAGDAVAKIIKGEGVLFPSCELLAESVISKEAEQDKILEFIQAWLSRYIHSTLEPLFNLKSDDIPSGCTTQVCDALFDQMGIIPRSEIEEYIQLIPEEERAILRTKKIRFGPLLVFLPELNKPALVRLRALLLSLWQGLDLPAVVPADGIVSFSVEGKDIDPHYYRSIGYPVYGPRSVRVDMLDRVICAVYDSAEHGKFKAQHKMAEWLGSNIADLYAVLEAMGHKKIYDPQDAIEQDTAKKEQDSEQGQNLESAAVVQDEEPEGEDTNVKSAEVKPELATFRLKKGKASETAQGKKPATDKKSSGKPPKKFKKKANKKPSKNDATHGRVYKAEVEKKLEDSPFAVLQQLQSGSKD